MPETVYNWDIEAMERLRAEIGRLRDVLAENRDLLVSEGFELIGDWQGSAGRKMFMVTAASADRLDKLIENYSRLSEQLENVISKCCAPCENEIAAKVKKLL